MWNPEKLSAKRLNWKLLTSQRKSSSDRQNGGQKLGEDWNCTLYLNFDTKTSWKSKVQSSAKIT